IDTVRLGNAALSRSSATTLLGRLAAMPARARLAIGLHYLRGLSADEIEQMLAPAHTESQQPLPLSHRDVKMPGEVPTDTPIAEILTHFRVAMAHALGMVPPEVDDTQLEAIDAWLDARLSEEAATALRRAAFEQPAVRAAREGMAAVRSLLMRSL